MDTAVPLGIIINEIFSNSLKYAFPDRKSGEIRIRLVREKERGLERNNWSKRKNQGFKGNASFILTVSDNGVGIPETFDLEKSESLGLKLIRVLADQLDENVRLNRNNGTEYIIKFAAGPA
ncbi:ATP-binding protein [Methanosarcina horonobensis]|uniref:ATP-binding protein n=1 Tax=Methanosarcina horonobensis TaxID=418008 RepID=UPI0009E21947